MSVLNVTDSESLKFGDMGDVLGKESENLAEMPVDSLDSFSRENVEALEITPKKTMENCEDSVILNKFSQLNLDANDHSKQENVNGLNGISRNENDNETEAPEHSEDGCDCRVCSRTRSSPNEDAEEMKQLSYLEVCHYVRTVYRTSSHRISLNEKYQDHMKNFVSLLCNLDPHELFHRLEAQIEDFITEIKVKLVELVHKDKYTSELPRIFISELLDGYKRLMIGASRLEPVLHELESVHLSKFQTTWKIINQSMYYSYVYSDPAIQNNMPVFISLLSSASSETAEIDKKLIRLFLSFDDEISGALQAWAETEASIKAYNASLKEKQEILNNEWHQFTSTLGTEISDGKESSSNDVSVIKDIADSLELFNFQGSDDSIEDVEVENVGSDDTYNENSECSSISDDESEVYLNSEEAETDEKGENSDGTTGRRAKENSRLCDSSDVCTCQQMINASQLSTPLDVKPDSKIPYPSAVDYPPPVFSEIAHPYSEAAPPYTEVAPPYPEPAPPYTETATPAPVQPRPLAKVAVPPNKSHPQGHLCHKHVGRSVEEEDSCADHAACNKRDSRQCSCCYCEVFGHAMTSVAPVSRNYQEIRDRLRFLLNKKKKSKPVPVNNKTKQILKEPPRPVASKQKPQEEVKDSRDLNELLNFIEGEVRMSKTAAKKAARKELLLKKKQEEIERKKREEEAAERQRKAEERRKEEERKEQQRLLEIEMRRKAKSKEKKKRHKEKVRQRQAEDAAFAAAALLESKGNQTNKKGKKNNKKNNSTNTNNARTNVNTNSTKTNKVSLTAALSKLNLKEDDKKESQIVTIKRVMESNSAEPTVTITLRGATLNEDKVLYTLFNGQVRPVKIDNRKSSNNSNNINNAKKKNSKNKPEANCSVKQLKNINIRNNQTDNFNTLSRTINVGDKKNNLSAVTFTKTSNSDVRVKMQPSTNNNSNYSPYQSSPMNGNGFFNNVTLTRNPPPQGMPYMPNSAPAFKPPTLPLPFKRSSLVLPEAELTSPTAIQINNAINKLAQPHNGNFDLENLKLPPGITITKVNPATVEERRPMQARQQQQQREREQQQQQQQHYRQQDCYDQQHPYSSQASSSNVIVVDTGKLQASKQYMDRSEISCENTSNSGKRRRRKKKTGDNGLNLPVNPSLNINKLGAKDIGKNPQAAIIKVNGSMVTIRSPALQQALDAQNPNNSCEQNKKKKSKKKKNPGQKPKEEWNLDNIFAPKDIDLENGDIDDDEKELEAFKRFCLQSVPPERKKKVHLNIKDIVMKKKGLPISCN